MLDPATGNCVGSPIGASGTNAGQFKAPRSVTSDGAGGMWVADALNYRVQHLHRRGQPRSASPVDASGDGNGQFRSPHCVTPIPGTTDVAVCDTFNFRISVWDGAGATPDVAGAHRRHQARPTAASTAPSRSPTDPTARSTRPTGSTTGSRSSTPTATSSPRGAATAPSDGSLIFPRGIVVIPDR